MMGEQSGRPVEFKPPTQSRPNSQVSSSLSSWPQGQSGQIQPYQANGGQNGQNGQIQAYQAANPGYQQQYGPSMPSAPSMPPGTKRKYVVWALEIAVFLCWIFIMSAGCFGFYLGFNTKYEKQSHDQVCGLTGKVENSTCGLNQVGQDFHKQVCSLCNEGSFDFLLILTSFYMAVFGFFGLFASCGTPFIMNRFGFLKNRCGRGFFLFFIGSLAVAQGLNFTYTEYLTLAAGIAAMSLGFCQMISYSCVSSGGVYQQQGGNQSVHSYDASPQTPMMRDSSGNPVQIRTVQNGR
jgi:hypothetical protein